MKLRYIATHHIRKRNIDEYSAFAEIIDWNARFICNWLSKAVRKLQIETGSVNMLCFIQSPSKKKSEILESSNSLISYIPLSMDDQMRLRAMPCLQDRYEFYLSFIEEGYIEASKSIPLPLDILFGLNDLFRQGGYKNEWLFKKKQIKEFGIYVYLNCYFTTSDFHLELEAYDLKKTRLIAKDVILRTPPDEICFDKDFRSIRINGSKLEILNFIGDVEITVNLEVLADGYVSVEYIDGTYLKWEERREREKQLIERLKW